MSPWFIALGDPGSGKSTAIKKMLLDYMANARDLARVSTSGIPIFIPLRDFARERQANGQAYSLLDFIYAYSKGSLNARCSSGFFEHYLESGECLVCFDGLDEVVTTGQRQEVSNIVESFIHRYPLNRYIVTSRIVGYEQAPLSDRLFPHLTVLPFQDSDIESYINKWYQSRQKSSQQAEVLSAELLNTIKNNDRLHDLAQHPLLLAIIALVHHIEAELPHERAKLYDKCSEALLSTFEAGKRLTRDDYEKEYYKYRRELLESIAYWMQTNVSNDSGRDIVVSQVELHEFLSRKLHDDPTFELSNAEARQQATDFIKLIEERTGLLIEKGERQYTFVHLTFQEYFAACYLLHNHDDNQMLSEIQQHLTDAGWREVILLLLGKLGDFPKKPSKIIDRVLQTPLDDEDILKRGLSFASSCMLDNIRIDISTQKRITEGWIEIIRRPLCYQQAQIAVDSLKKLNKYTLVSDLIQKVIIDDGEEPEARIRLLEIYRDQQVSRMMPEWVWASIQRIALDQRIKSTLRFEALKLAILSVPLEDFTKFIVNSFHSDSDFATISYFLFTSPGMDDYLRRSQSTVFITWMSILCPDLVDQTLDEVKLPSTLPANVESWFQKLIEQEPLYALELGNLGWEPAWEEIIKIIKNTNQVNEKFSRFILRCFDLNFLNPGNKHEDLIQSLLGMGVRVEMGPIIADTTRWLELLNYPPKKLFEFVMTIDKLFNNDDWNVDIMSSFFAMLIRRAREQSEQAQLNHEDIVSSEWFNDIKQGHHFTLQLSFLQGLLKTNHQAARNFSIEMFEQCRTSKQDDDLGRLVLILIEAGGLELGSAEAMLKQLLSNFKNSWVRASSAFQLRKNGFVSNEELHDTFLEIVENEKENIYLKQDLASFLAKELGEREKGLNILREIILNPEGNDRAKNQAFIALQQIIDPSTATSQRQDYRELATAPTQNWSINLML